MGVSCGPPGCPTRATCFAQGAGRRTGASCGDAREGASLPARPAGSVGQRRGGGNAGPTRTILTAARPAARAPARPPARDTARRRRSAPPAPGGGGAGRGGAPGRGRAGAHPGRGAPGRSRAARRRGRAPLPRRGCRDALGLTPLSRGGRRRFRASCVTSVSPRRADVWRCKFKSCHWPGAAWLFPLHFPPQHQP